MLTAQEFNRFFEFRKKIFDLIRKSDDVHKSYEGAVDLRLSYKNVYESESVYDIDFVTIEIHSSILANGHHTAFAGRTFDIAMLKAENWIKFRFNV